MAVLVGVMVMVAVGTFEWQLVRAHRQDTEEQCINEQKNVCKKCRILKDGSPLKISCANTYSQKTANTSSTYREINKATGPVSLFLIPQAFSKEIHEIG